MSGLCGYCHIQYRKTFLFNKLEFSLILAFFVIQSKYIFLVNHTHNHTNGLINEIWIKMIEYKIVLMVGSHCKIHKEPFKCACFPAESQSLFQTGSGKLLSADTCSSV